LLSVLAANKLSQISCKIEKQNFAIFFDKNLPYKCWLSPFGVVRSPTVNAKWRNRNFAEIEYQQSIQSRHQLKALKLEVL